MKQITLEDGSKGFISEETYNNLKKSIKNNVLELPIRFEFNEDANNYYIEKNMTHIGLPFDKESKTLWYKIGERYSKYHATSDGWRVFSHYPDDRVDVEGERINEKDLQVGCFYYVTKKTEVNETKYKHKYKLFLGKTIKLLKELSFKCVKNDDVLTDEISLNSDEYIFYKIKPKENIK